jgi:Fe-S cluster biogenesis protein NfuA
MSIPFSDDDLNPAVLNSLEKVKPMLARDGGGIELIDIRDGMVYVQLQAACVGCSSSSQTLKHGVERQLQMDIHQELRVINVPHGMEDKLEELEYTI